MPYLLRQSGVRNMVIQRVHYAVKRQFAEQKNFEFFWRQNWGMLFIGVIYSSFRIYSFIYLAYIVKDSVD